MGSQSKHLQGHLLEGYGVKTVREDPSTKVPSKVGPFNSTKVLCWNRGMEEVLKVEEVDFQRCKPSKYFHGITASVHTLHMSKPNVTCV